MSTPEGKIQNEICEYLRKKGAFFWRANSMPVYDAKLNSGYGGYRSQGKLAMKGVADILLVDAYGSLHCIEVKAPRGKISADQLLFKRRIEEHNAYYYVVKNVKELEEIKIVFK